MAIKYLFASFLVFGNGVGDEAMSPPFASANLVIDASSALPEAVIASLLPTTNIKKEATFLRTIKLLIAIKLSFACADAKQAFRHLARQLALTMHYCKCGFVLQ